MPILLSLNNTDKCLLVRHLGISGDCLKPISFLHALEKAEMVTALVPQTSQDPHLPLLFKLIRDPPSLSPNLLLLLYH